LSSKSCSVPSVVYTVRDAIWQTFWTDERPRPRPHVARHIPQTESVSPSVRRSDGSIRCHRPPAAVALRFTRPTPVLIIRLFRACMEASATVYCSRANLHSTSVQFTQPRHLLACRQMSLYGSIRPALSFRELLIWLFYHGTDYAN